ncbi:MAG: glycosyltransferase [Planctomycetota bacterium]
MSSCAMPRGRWALRTGCAGWVIKPTNSWPRRNHAATALWFPSVARSEGFGLAQVEAMASGCPVINTAIPGSGVPWVSLHGVSGLTVPVEDPAALAEAARHLSENATLRASLAEGARARAVSEFDHSLMASRWDLAVGA